MRPTNSIFAELPRQSNIEIMESIKDRLALESLDARDFVRSMSEAIPKLVDTTKKYLHDIASYSKSFVNFSGDTVPAGYKPQEDVHAIVSMLKKQDYANLMPLGIYVPEGFVGKLAEYAVHERKCVDHALKLLSGVLNPYNTYLAGLVSSPDAVKDSATPNLFLKKVDEERDSLNRDEGFFFKPGTTHTRRPMGEVISRMADWETVFTQQSAMNAALQGISNTSVQQAVNTCLELLDAVKQAAKSGQFDHISPANVKSLASATLSIAREVEFYAVTRQRVNVFNVALDETSAFLKSALK